MPRSLQAGVTAEAPVCVLDDDKTAAGARQIQWRIPLADALPVVATPRKSKAAGLVRAGIKRNWLYTQKRHTDPKRLEKELEAMIFAGINA